MEQIPGLADVKSSTEGGYPELQIRFNRERLANLDLALPGMLHAKVLRSPHPHARVVRVDKSRAEKLPGVEAGESAEAPETEILVELAELWDVSEPEPERAVALKVLKGGRFAGEKLVKRFIKIDKLSTAYATTGDRAPRPSARLKSSGG